MVDQADERIGTIVKHPPDRWSHAVPHNCFAAVMPRQRNFEEIAHEGVLILRDKLMDVNEPRERAVYGFFTEPN